MCNLCWYRAFFPPRQGMSTSFFTPGFRNWCRLQYCQTHLSHLRATLQRRGKKKFSFELFHKQAFSLKASLFRKWPPIQTHIAKLEGEEKQHDVKRKINVRYVVLDYVSPFYVSSMLQLFLARMTRRVTLLPKVIWHRVSAYKERLTTTPLLSCCASALATIRKCSSR